MACRHVREQTDGKAERAGEIGDDLDRHDQEPHRPRQAGRQEDREEVQAVAQKAHQRREEKHEQSESARHDDVARVGERIGQKAQKVAHQHDHEKREHKGEELARVIVQVVVHHAGDEFVKHFGDVLPAAGNHGFAAHSQRHERGRGENADEHPQC